MIRQILQVGDPRLRERSKLMTPMRASLRPTAETILVRDLLETMQAARGVGLAAIQIGHPLRVFTMNAGGGVIVVVNPTVLSTGGEWADAIEGCLSLPVETHVVGRAKQIEIDYSDHNGTPKSDVFSGLEARVIQHELDHLDGRLICDRRDPYAPVPDAAEL